MLLGSLWVRVFYRHSGCSNRESGEKMAEGLLPQVCLDGSVMAVSSGKDNQIPAGIPLVTSG